ncbi:MAG: hypothetical protein OEU46_23910 [Alphaproteobacteria bacterium]|nr:hypothetical protein [Alphaproteobacteria bacterium]
MSRQENATVKFKIVVGVILLALAFGTDGIRAASLGDWAGEISTSVIHPIPSNSTVDVLIYDDTAQNIAFRAHFLRALREAGYRTSHPADLQFTFATSITWQISRQRELERLQLQRYPVDMEEATFPDERRRDVGSAPASHLLGDARRLPPRVTPTITNTDQDRLDISVELRGRASGTILWTADLALPLKTPDRARIIAAITGPIIGAIGRDIRRERFEIR